MINKYIIILALSILNITSVLAQQTVAIDRIIGVVGKKEILESDIENRFFQYKARGIEMGGDIRCKILEEFLFQGLLLNQAEKDSIEVSDKEIDVQLESRLRMFIDQIGGEDELEKYFNKTIPEIKNQLREIVSDEIVTDRMQRKITSETKVSPAEVKDFFARIPKDSLPVIESEMELSEIVLYPKIDEDQTNKAISKLENYKKRVIEDKEDFSTLAIMYSEDPGSAKNGGDLGLIRRNDVVPEFAEAAFSLKNPGDISEVIKTDFGYHIIQLVEQKGESMHLKHILIAPKIPIDERIRVKTILTQIADSIRRGQLTFKQAVEKYSEDESSKNVAGNLINYATGNTRFTQSDLPKTIEAAVRKLKIGEISDPIEDDDMKGKAVYKIILLSSKSSSHIADLKTDYQKISNFALEEKKDKVINEWIIEKQKTTFIELDNSYDECDFRYKGWIENKLD